MGEECGEPGRTRGPLASARELVSSALDAVHADMPLSGQVAVMLNGMGATPLVELYVAYADVASWLTAHGVTVARSLVGNYITSLDMAGFSVTVGMLTDEQLTELATASGAEFDRLFLEYMIYHHEGAITMVDDLRGGGGAQEPEMAQLVLHIESDQRIEIKRMQGLLDELDSTG